MAGNGRTSADSVLIAALAGGATVAAAARLARVSERTVYRRLEEPEFCQQITAARADMLTRAVGGLAQASTAAVDTLAALLKPRVAATVRLGAARAILELGTRLREAEDVERRLAELEENWTARIAALEHELEAARTFRRTA